MEEEKIKSLPITDTFTDYFIRRAKRILKLKNSEYVSITFDIFMRSKHIWVWFHTGNGIIAKVEFEFSGAKISKSDYRTEGG